MFKRNLSLVLIIRRNITLKTDLKIKWIEPNRLPIIHPESSFDTIGPVKLDLSKPTLEFTGSKELEDANENVKKLFSLMFAKRYYARLYAQNELIKTVQQHKYDFESYEVCLARRTEHIRWLQESVANGTASKDMRVRLQERILTRKKKLKILRSLDYKKFEWILEKLDLIYKNSPTVIDCTRRYALRKLTSMYCDDVRNNRLMELRRKFREEQPKYLAEKIEKLIKFRNDQIKLGLKVTITEEDIEKTREELNKLNLQITAQ